MIFSSNSIWLTLPLQFYTNRVVASTLEFPWVSRAGVARSFDCWAQDSSCKWPRFGVALPNAHSTGHWDEFWDIQLLKCLCQMWNKKSGIQLIIYSHIFVIWPVKRKYCGIYVDDKWVFSAWQFFSTFVNITTGTWGGICHIVVSQKLSRSVQNNYWELIFIMALILTSFWKEGYISCRP